MESNEVKVERSMPVNARIDVVDLAELAKYWSDNGHYIKSISQLVSWSINLLKEILVENNQVKPELDMITARDYLKQRGLTQPSNERKANKKIAAAIRFTQMRKEGLNPQFDDPINYHEVHNQHSVKSPQLPIEESLHARIKAQRKLNEEQNELKRQRLAAYKEKNIVVSSSSADEVLRNDQELNNQLDELIKRKENN